LGLLIYFPSAQAWTADQMMTVRLHNPAQNREKFDRQFPASILGVISADLNRREVQACSFQA